MGVSSVFLASLKFTTTHEWPFGRKGYIFMDENRAMIWALLPKSGSPIGTSREMIKVSALAEWRELIDLKKLES